jgi:predicted nucleic acid-binding protein
MIVVADASPLIAMARIRRLDLLRSVFGQLLVPDAVWREVVEAGEDKAGTIDVTAANWIERRAIVDSSLVNLLRHDLGAGEAEAIVLAREARAISY